MSLTLHVSDLHIGHKAICKYRPFYNSTHHDLYMITMLFLNADFRSILIPHGDSVFVNTYDDVLKNIWGIYQKVYDLGGNHCYENVKLKDKFFMTLDNVEVQAFFKKYNVWNSHAPVHPAELRDRLNLHGHVHDETVKDHRYVNCSMESEIMKYWPRNHQYLVANAATVEFRDHSLSRRDKWVNHLTDIFAQELPRQLYDYTRVIATSEELTRAHLATLASFRRDTFVKSQRAVLADMKRFADAGLELFSKFKPEELADLLHNKHYGTMFYAEHYGDV